MTEGDFPAQVSGERGCVILSDVHLNVAPDGRERMARFTRFLRGVDPSRINRMILLGDLFDFWFEYRHVIFSGYFEVVRAFADLRDAGVQFDFVCGNHDFWGGRFLHETLGFRIHPDRLEETRAGRRLLFVHGDGIDPHDYGYKAYKWVARKPIIVGAFRLLHPDWAMGIAQAVSRGSRRMFGSRHPGEGLQVRVMERFARDTIGGGAYDVVVCGHSHYPVKMSVPAPEGEGLYINTGDWIHHQSFIEWFGDEFRIEYDRHGATETPSCSETGPASGVTGHE